MINPQDNRRISITAAKKVLEIMFLTGETALPVIERFDLWLLPLEEVARITYLIVCDNPELSLRYRDGNDKIINALIGKVMAQVKGRSTGSAIEELIKASIHYIYKV